MLDVGLVVVTASAGVFSGWLSLASQFIELLSAVHHIVVHS